MIYSYTNPCLYAKNDKNFKDNKLKDMKWETIAETLNCTGSEARKRWESLRGQFCRKRRQQKNQPSGSGTLAEWPLMSLLSFLTPHIQNRKARSSSLLQRSTLRCNETSSSCSPAINSPVRPVSSSSANRVIQSQNTTSSSSLLQRSTLRCFDSEYFAWNDHESQEIENIENKENTENAENIPTEYVLHEVPTKETGNVASIPQTTKTPKKRNLVPPLDKFAQNKKACNERLEALLTKSSIAVSDLAVACNSATVEEKKPVVDPNASVIAQALKSVAPENQLSCLIAVLQLINSFNQSFNQ
ncbi:uncharacterized protein [Temnothorax nylanderi]|uniref:uncharacterized protein n=1 Tax=Temnothorax nylanderi TaxID=102681 RepID=UPI003A880573